MNQRHWTIPIDEDGLVAFLGQLVQIQSINPPGNEGPVASVIGEKLASLGFEVSTFHTPSGRPNIVATFDSGRPGRTLLFNGHMDVLPPGTGWVRDPFGAEIVDGKLYGRGSLDMKAGLAAALYACEAVLRAGADFNGKIVYTAVADEVGGGFEGTGFLVSQGLVTADAVIVCEPSGPDVRLAHRGALWAQIEVQGKSAHGGRPWLGVSAISKMAKIIGALEETLPALWASQPKHWCLPAPTLNLGIISGGHKINLVSDRCTLKVDRRLLPGESADEALAQIRAVVDSVRQADAQEFAASVETIMVIEPTEVPKDAEIVQRCVAAFEAVTGEAAGLSCTAGFEDAHFFVNNLGIPTCMYGPFQPRPDDPQGTISGGYEEHVELSWLRVAALVYARVILDFLGTGDLGPSNRL